jgi:hypothetical protein
MLCSRIAAGGFALVAVFVANASAQGCLLPWGCEGPGLSGSVKPRATGANLTRNTRNHLSLAEKERWLKIAEEWRALVEVAEGRQSIFRIDDFKQI